jgi:hypothetical protein
MRNWTVRGEKVACGDLYVRWLKLLRGSALGEKHAAAPKSNAYHNAQESNICDSAWKVSNVVSEGPIAR